MSPFGPYENFDACLAANQDKSSPEGFCAYLHHKITGEWPSQATAKHTPEWLATFEADISHGLSEALKRFNFQAVETKRIKGVEVFAAGEWTDSSGEKRLWTKADLKEIVQAFKAGAVAVLKVGHTSDDFNKRVAAALGVSLDLLQGDPQGRGQMALGHATELSLKGDKLIAEFEGVPTPLADLIEGGQYASVSSEIEFDEKGSPRLTGVALLGVEKPAVSNLAPLMASVFGAPREGVKVVSFTKEFDGETPSKKEENVAKITTESSIKDVVATFADGAADALTAIAVALGLDPGSATLANVLKAIEQLKAGPAVPPEEMAKHQAEFSALSETVKQQKTLLATYEHERRVAKYSQMAAEWKAVAGKPEDIGKSLSAIEEKAGEEAANLVVAQFQAANKVAVDAGVLTRVGRASKPGKEPEDEFEKVVKARATEKKLSYQQALAQIAVEQPREFGAYRSRKNGGEGA